MVRKFFAVSILESLSCRIPVPAGCLSASPAIDGLLFEQLVRKSDANKLSGAKPRRKQFNPCKSSGNFYAAEPMDFSIA